MPALPPTSARPSQRERAFQRLMSDVRCCASCSRMTHSRVLGAANGPLDARVMFVAEAPGRRGAALTGVPLNGDESGRRFETFLQIAGLTRDDVFVTNAVLCNPLDAHDRNRSPLTSEVRRCRPFLAATLDIVNPLFVVALGRVALESLRAIAPHDAKLPQGVALPVAWRGGTLIAMYHPSQQSTLHRSHEQQQADWRRLGEIVKTVTR